MTDLSANPTSSGRRYALLLAAMVVFIVVWPAFAPQAHESRWIRMALLSAVLSIAFLVTPPGRMRRVVIVIIAAELAAGWAAQFTDDTFVLLGRYVLGVAFNVLMVTIILRFVLAHGRVTTERIVAALCAYLFLGVLWADLYGVIEVLDGPAFRFPDATGGTDTALTYVSFVTLTTLGYGDVTPVHPLARSLAIHRGRDRPDLSRRPGRPPRRAADRARHAPARRLGPQQNEFSSPGSRAPSRVGD